MSEDELLPDDSAEHFTTPGRQIALLLDAIDAGGVPYLAYAVGIVARARGMELDVQIQPDGSVILRGRVAAL